MSCDNKLQVDIAKTDNVCDERCSFYFKYNSNSSCMTMNKGDYLEVTVDGPNTVLFNGNDIEVTKFRIYWPSLHLFNGVTADAELVIEHGSGQLVKPLLVCVPITKYSGAGRSVSGQFFHQFIPVVPSKKDEQYAVNVNQWSLNDIVPDAPFFYYVGSEPYYPCKAQYNIIVFAKDHAATMDSSDMEILKQVITSAGGGWLETAEAVTDRGPVLMMNKLGSGPPGTTREEQVVFEDCQPIAGMEGEEGPTQEGGTAPTVLYLFLLILGVLVVAAAIKWLCSSGLGGGGGGASLIAGGGRRRGHR